MPRKKQIITRSEYISFRVSNIEKKVIELTAKDAGLNSSTFVRRAALNKKVVVRFTPEELQIYNDLQAYHRNFKLIGNLIRGNSFDKKARIQEELFIVMDLIKKHLKFFEI